jgi:glycosyltransferase involved in cell wall biosynthesis
MKPRSTPDPVDTGRAAVRPQRRILIIAPFPPHVNGAHGGARAVAQLIVSLAERHEVALAYLRATDEAPIDATIERSCAHVIEGRRAGSVRSSIRPIGGAGAVIPGLVAGLPLWVAGRRSGPLAAGIRKLIESWRPQLIQAEFSAMGQYLPSGTGTTSRTVVSFHEPGAAAAEERVAQRGPFSMFWRLEARRWRRFERALLRRVDGVVAFTARDAAFLRELHADARTVIVPLSVAVPELAGERVTDPPRILFVGNFVHPPNVDAARFLADEIQPLLRAEFTDLELWIVGPGAPRHLLGRAAEGVVVPGFVPEMADYLARAAVVVAPVRLGSGVRVKVLEAMAAGKPVVTTPLAAEGIDAVAGRDFLVAEGAAGFRDAIALLLRDPARRRAVGDAARGRVAARHSGERTVAALEALYDRLLAAPARAPGG